MYLKPDTTRRDIRKLREALPSWASVDAVLEKIRTDETVEAFSDSDLFYRENGDVAITLDFEVIVVFQDMDRPGLYCYGRYPIVDSRVRFYDPDRVV